MTSVRETSLQVLSIHVADVRPSPARSALYEGECLSIEGRETGSLIPLVDSVCIYEGYNGRRSTIMRLTTDGNSTFTCMIPMVQRYQFGTKQSSRNEWSEDRRLTVLHDKL